MQQVTISGTLLADAEKCVDTNGRTYSRFTVSCGSKGPGGRTEYTQYRCTCYITGYEDCKKGDQIFLTGKLSAKLKTDEKGKVHLNLDVMIHFASGGYKYAERKR